MDGKTAQRSLAVGGVVASSTLLLGLGGGGVQQGWAAGNTPWEGPLMDIAAAVMAPVVLAGFLIALGVFCIAGWLGYSALWGCGRCGGCPRRCSGGGERCGTGEGTER